MDNVPSLPDDPAAPRLYPMDPDQARYHCEKLRALADLLLAGEPVLWTESTLRLEAGLERVSVVLDTEHLMRAHIAVRARIAEGDPDYAIRVEPRPRARGRSKAWMGQAGRPV